MHEKTSYVEAANSVLPRFWQQNGELAGAARYTHRKRPWRLTRVLDTGTETNIYIYTYTHICIVHRLTASPCGLLLRFNSPWQRDRARRRAVRRRPGKSHR
jgi:hypothetical protein